MRSCPLRVAFAAKAFESASTSSSWLLSALACQTEVGVCGLLHLPRRPFGHTSPHVPRHRGRDAVLTERDLKSIAVIHIIIYYGTWSIAADVHQIVDVAAPPLTRPQLVTDKLPWTLKARLF